MTLCSCFIKKKKKKIAINKYYIYDTIKYKYFFKKQEERERD